MKRWLLVILIICAFHCRSDVTQPVSKPGGTNQLGQLVQRGKELYESGKLAEARVTLVQTLKLDPSNKAAEYYLDLVKEGDYRNRSEGRSRYGSEDILPTNPPKSAATGEWLADRRLRLGQKATHSELLNSKKFELDPAMVLATFPMKAEAAHYVTQGELTFLMRTNKTAELHEKIKKWFASKGADLTAPGKSVFFNDRTGLLLVRGTQADLAAITVAVEPWTARKPNENSARKP